MASMIKPLQKRAEIRELFLRARALRPRAVVEIGTNNEGTFFLLCRAASPDAVVISIDLPGGRFGGGYPVLRSPYFYLFASGRQRVHLIRQDSHAAATQDWGGSVRCAASRHVRPGRRDDSSNGGTNNVSEPAQDEVET